MKKTLLILVAIVFIVTACEKQTYVDGTYSATYNEPDSRGWNTVVEFTLTEDMISNVDYDEFDGEGNRKTEDTDYNVRMLDMGGVTKPETYAPQIEAAIANTTIVPSYEPIDAITGATGSSNSANALMEAALDAAVEGEPTNIVVTRPSE